MIFCGQCGLQLAAGTTRCPRCGATVEETNTYKQPKCMPMMPQWRHIR